MVTPNNPIPPEANTPWPSWLGILLSTSSKFSERLLNKVRNIYLKKTQETNHPYLNIHSQKSSKRWLHTKEHLFFTGDPGSIPTTHKLEKATPSSGLCRTEHTRCTSTDVGMKTHIHRHKVKITMSQKKKKKKFI